MPAVRVYQECSHPLIGRKLWSTFKVGIQQSVDRNTPYKVCSKQKSYLGSAEIQRSWDLKPGYTGTHGGQTSGTLSGHSKNNVKRMSREQRLTISMISSRKDLTRITGEMSKSNCQDSIGVPPLKKMGQLVNVTKEKAQIMVKQFQSAFTRDNNYQLPDTNKRARRPVPPLLITVDGVEKLLHGINLSKAQGPD